MSQPFKTITLADILTEAEIKKATRLYRRCKPGGEFNRRVVAEIVSPVMPRINAATGQENDARFIGYAIEHCLLHARYKTGGR